MTPEQIKSLLVRLDQVATTEDVPTMADFLGLTQESAAAIRFLLEEVPKGRNEAETLSNR